MKTFIIIFLMVVNMYSQDYNWVKLADSLQFPEGPAYCSKTNTLYLSSCYGGFILKIQNNKAEKFIDSLEQPFKLKQTNGLTISKEGNILACDYGIGAILEITPEGKSTIISSGYNDKKFNRPNDLALDDKGNLYFTDPKSYDKEILDGVIYKLNLQSREVTPVAKDLAFPNGIAFDRNYENIYVCESAKNRILKYKLKNEKLIEQKVFVELPGGDPDGIAFDEEGNLIAAHFGTGIIFVIDKNGKIINKIKAPGKKPSNVEFGGENMKTLYITEDETNSVYKTQVETAGLKLIR